MYVYTRVAQVTGLWKPKALIVLVHEGDEKRASTYELEPEYNAELTETSSVFPSVYSVSPGKCSFLFLSKKFYSKMQHLYYVQFMYKIQRFLCYKWRKICTAWNVV
jgi:hypothetical protein